MIVTSSRLERQACAMGSFDEQRKKYIFVILSVLGWSKLLSLDWLSRKFPRLNIFAQKKLSMLDRTLTTHNDKIMQYKFWNCRASKRHENNTMMTSIEQVIQEYTACGIQNQGNSHGWAIQTYPTIY